VKVSYRPHPFESDAAVEWDDLVARAPMATFLHTRRFLGYHGDRFEDVSLLIRDGRDKLVAVLPAAVDPAGGSRVSSHPGITYGGLVHAGDVVGERMLEVLGAVARHYGELGFESLSYKAVPHIYHRVPSLDDVYALFRHRAVLDRCDLSTAIDLDARRAPSDRRRRALRKAEASDVQLVGGPARVEEFWRLLEANLESRHGASPVHDPDEIRLLHSLFPTEIEFVFAEVDGRIVAGLVLFHTPRVTHVQYAAADDEGRKMSALDHAIEHCIEEARQRGVRFFNLGVSTESEGHFLNDGLHKYKVEFGGGGVVHQFFELGLGGGAR
jgi:hypothetical protein